MTLGQLIQRIVRAQDIYLDQLGLDDLPLLARINAAADGDGIKAEAFVADAVHTLLASHDSGTWTTLMGKLQDDAMPGRAFITMAVQQHLSQSPAASPRKSGGCGGGGGCGCNG